MASSIGGAKGSTSRPEPRGKPDPGAAARRVRVMQLLVMQGVLAVLLLGLAFLSRDDPRTLALCLWTLLVPAGFAYAYGSANARHDRARRDGTWTKEWEKKETSRGFSILAGVGVLWVAGALLVLALT